MSFLFESVNRERSLSDPCSETSASSSSSDHPVALAALAAGTPAKTGGHVRFFFLFSRENKSLGSGFD